MAFEYLTAIRSDELMLMKYTCRLFSYTVIDLTHVSAQRNYISQITEWICICCTSIALDRYSEEQTEGSEVERANRNDTRWR